MKIKIEANLAISKEYFSHIGNLTIRNREIVKFEKTENSHIIEHFSDKIFPIKRSEFEIQFLDEFHDEFKMFSALIKIKDSIRVGVKLNRFEKLKLKWMLKKYWVQNHENAWKVFVFITATTIAIITLIYKASK